MAVWQVANVANAIIILVEYVFCIGLCMQA